MRKNMDLAVVLFREELTRTISNSPLPITVKSMILDIVVAQVKSDEEYTISHLLSEGGNDINVNFGSSETETIQGTAADLLAEQRSISAGNVESTEHTEE